MSEAISSETGRDEVKRDTGSDGSPLKNPILAKTLHIQDEIFTRTVDVSADDLVNQSNV
jgi:hypothetical protein